MCSDRGGKGYQTIVGGDTVVLGNTYQVGKQKNVVGVRR